MRTWPMLLAASLVLAACSSSSNRGASLIPDQELRLTSALSVPLGSIASAAFVVGAIHVIYDPLAPNWEIEEARLGDDTVRFSLRMKRYHTGGAGESLQIVKRRAVQLQNELGYGGYQLLEYSEGIDSQTLGARRVADGMVKLVNRQAADSFLLNER